VDLKAMAHRVAGYDFKTKVMINRLVLEEIKREAGLDSTNTVAQAIMDSQIHDAIQQLADAIHDEADRIRGAQIS
jgi:hypothetical protein